ncbi:MAG: protein-L-isoaspartate(D-aspartate) O-methyltransferase [Candidatus Omnitrophota bacterium]|nr:MAG: protein-L-isoaspartate(D-aspartate) O-methyltransferase [Candidatus Omnitrophota bacterium]
MDFDALRERMVSEQILQRGIEEPKILEAFRAVERHLFVSEQNRKFAYEDYPLPIGENQTISQPYIVALMTQHLEVGESQKVLEVGTGSGYQAAILSYLGASVYSIERVPALAQKAKLLLDSLKCKVEVKAGDSTLGWPQNAPYDRIIVTAASPAVSPCWIEQLKVEGRMVIPLGGPLQQELTVVKKISVSKIDKEVVCACMFVPLLGEYGYK